MIGKPSEREFGPGITEKEMKRRTRRAFLTMGISATAAIAAWNWLLNQPYDAEQPWPLRDMLRFNQKVSEAVFHARGKVAVYPAAAVQPLRVNGDVGLVGDFDPASWQLTLQPSDASMKPKSLVLSDIQQLPRVEQTTELKCIEGWSVVNHWVGARFSDFTARFAPQSASAPYVSMRTPDSQYFVGLDMASAMHPQTLLCYEMNGAPLGLKHGAPLRLAVPIKYGIKNIKRIGAITYTAQRPRDYWAEDGYDWYAGL